MKNKAGPSKNQPQSLDYVFAPSITTVAFPLLLFGSAKKTGTAQEKQPKHNQKSKGLAVAKYELSESSVKFFGSKGFPKKHWVLLKEIPLQRITAVESFGSELSLTWNGLIYEFALKKSESFSALRDQLQGMLDDRHLETADKSEAEIMQKSELARVINGSIGIVDLSFDILMGLQGKRVDWVRLEKCAADLGGSWSFIGQTLQPMNLDFAGIGAAVKRQVPKVTSQEAYNILKQVYTYFNGLKPIDDTKESSVSFENAKAAVLAYFMLNDVLLGKVVGDLDNVKERAALESVLMQLADESNVKVDASALNLAVDEIGVKADGTLAVGDARGIFRKQLKNL